MVSAEYQAPSAITFRSHSIWTLRGARPKGDSRTSPPSPPVWLVAKTSGGASANTSIWPFSPSGTTSGTSARIAATIWRCVWISSPSSSVKVAVSSSSRTSASWHSGDSSTTAACFDLNTSVLLSLLAGLEVDVGDDQRLRLDHGVDVALAVAAMALAGARDVDGEDQLGLLARPEAVVGLDLA